MKKYIEVRKNQTNEQAANGEPIEEIRVEVSNTTLSSYALSQIECIRNVFGWTQENSTAQLHECFHGESPNRPCRITPESDLELEAAEE